MITCKECNGLCCRKVSFDIGIPETKTDFENVRWYFYHGFLIFINNKKSWHAEKLIRCRMLSKDNRCKIYRSRPPTCKAYPTIHCLRNDSDVIQKFNSLKEYNRFLDEKFK